MALVVLSGSGGFLFARHISPSDAYAEEILACRAAEVAQTLFVLRHVDPANVPRTLKSSLVFHELWLHQAIADLPAADPELANKALSWIDSYCSEHDCSTGDPEITRSLEEQLAEYRTPAPR